MDLLVVQLQQTDRGPRQQQSEKTEKLMESSVDLAVWKLLASLGAAGCVLWFVSLAVVEVEVAVVAAAVAAESYGAFLCSQFHF